MPDRPSLPRALSSRRRSPTTPHDPSLPPPPIERRTSSTGSLNALTRTFTKTLRHDVSLADILSGQTCSPIGFKDLESFLAHKEFSLENLLFLVWFRSYQRRFLTLPAHVQARATRPEARKGDAWGTGRRRAFERSMGLTVDEGVEEEALDEKSGKKQAIGSGRKGEKETGAGTEYGVKLGSDGEVEVRRVGFQKCAWTQEGLSCTYNPHASDSTTPSAAGSSTSLADKAHEQHCSNAKHFHSTSTPLHLTASCAADDEDDGELPFREECRRAYAAKELNLEDKVRERVKLQLLESTHPDCWLAAYEATYVLLETHSLGNFLNFAEANIEMPKRFFWYLVGTIDLALSVLILLLAIFLLPSHPFGWRAVRLVSALFACFGSMQVYSASKGFCTQVWGRASRQAHPWEMEDLAEDEEAAIGGGGSAPATALATKAPPVITISTSLAPSSVSGEDLAPSPTSTQFSPGATNKDLPKVDKDVENLSNEDQLAPLPPPNLTSPPLPYLGSSPPRLPSSSSRRHRPLTPRTDAEISSFLIPVDLLPASSAGLPTSTSASASSLSLFALAKSASRLSLGLGANGGSSGPIPMKITHSATNRAGAELFSWGDPDEEVEEVRRRTRRPKIFGPEVVIEDPRVLALHKRVVNQILLVGLAWTGVWVGVCLAVPGAR